jgi:TetR/AcrR family transcriptional regulator, transcriptional repressor for nem operon
MTIIIFLLHIDDGHHKICQAVLVKHKKARLSMRVSREKAAETRERILDAASALFRAKGFGGIGVADIMKAADLTHGGFYGHFASKEDLVAEASRRSTARAAASWERVVAAAPDKPYAALLDHYLAASHRDEPGKGCAFAALGADAARGNAAVRKAFAEGLRPLLDIITNALPGFSKPARRRKAVAAMSTLVGALTLARAVDDPALSNEILDAARQELRAAAYR